MTDPGESCDQFCTLRYGMTAFDFECDADRMAALGNSSIALSASNAGKYPLFEPFVKDCGALAPAVRESDDMTFYFDQECATGLTPSCYAYAEGIRRLCLCRKRRRQGNDHCCNSNSQTRHRQQCLSAASAALLDNRLGVGHAVVLVALVLTLTLATQSSAHNWVETPSRARSRASTTRPCQIRKASDLHAQIGKEQSHVIKFAMGHASTSYWAVVKGEDENWLSHPDFKKMLLDYLEKAPESANRAFEPKYKRYHATDDRNCDTTTNDAPCLKPFMDMTNPDTAKDSTINLNNGWCDKASKPLQPRVPSTDRIFDHKLEPTEWMSGNQKRGAYSVPG